MNIIEKVIRIYTLENVIGKFAENSMNMFPNVLPEVQFSLILCIQVYHSRCTLFQKKKISRIPLSSHARETHKPAKTFI